MKYNDKSNKFQVRPYLPSVPVISYENILFFPFKASSFSVLYLLKIVLFSLFTRAFQSEIVMTDYRQNNS